MTTTTAPPIGRDAELSTLFGFLDRVERLPRAVVLDGEAGVGKTTLVDAVVSAAEARGYRVLVCRPAEAEVAMSFGALRDLLDPVFDDVANELRPLERRAMQVALLREEPGTAPPAPEAVAAGFLTILRTLARRAPLLVATDDSHWLDRSTARILGFAIRRLRNEPIALLVAMRPGAAGGIGEVLRRSFDDDRLVHLSVGPLSLGAIHFLLRARLGSSVSRPLLQRIYDTAGGNPFFALQIARGLDLDPRRISGEPLPVPPTLREAVEDRLVRLSDDARELLTVVSAMPRPTLDSVRALAEPVGADRALAEAERAGIIHVEEDRIRFTHPLLAAQTYGHLTTTERRRVHARLAEVAEGLEERARHLALAVDGPDEAVASTLEDASDDASSRGAPIAAAELLETAARLTPEGLHDRRWWRQLKAARAHFIAGDSEIASDVLSALLVELPGGRLRAEVMVTLGIISFFTDDHAATRTYYEATIAEPGAPPTVVFEAHDGLVWLLSREDIVAAVRHAHAAVAIAEELGDDGAVAKALATCGMAESLLGRNVAADLIARGVGMARGREYARVMQRPEFAKAITLAWSDDLSGALEGFERLLAHAVERADESSMVRLLLGVSHVRLLTGDWEAANRYATEAYEAGLLSGQHPQFKMLFFSKALVDAHLGMVEDVRRSSVSWGEDDPFGDVAGGVERVANGFLELSLGHPDEAHRVLAPLVERMLHSGLVEPAAVRFVPDDVEALIQLDRLDDAEATLRWYESCAKKTRRRSALAAAERCRGLLLAARGDVAPSLSAFERALGKHDRVPMPFERARTLLAAGVTRRRAKQKRAARDAIDEARGVFENLGARLWSERARAEIGRIGGRTAAVGLTSTERRLADLVAQGRSNKEVAAALFVTVKTVEATLSRIYGKLHVRSRAELVRAFARADTEGVTDGTEPPKGGNL
jgi:DNA-binding CsgD family transcriptional regulator